MTSSMPEGSLSVSWPTQAALVNHEGQRKKQRPLIRPFFSIPKGTLNKLPLSLATTVGGGGGGLEVRNSRHVSKAGGSWWCSGDGLGIVTSLPYKHGGGGGGGQGSNKCLKSPVLPRGKLFLNLTIYFLSRAGQKQCRVEDIY